MKTLARPTQIALGVLLALLLAVMPLQPMAVYADDAAGAPDASGTPAVQPEDEGPEGGLGENPAPSTGTDEAAKQDESAGEHKDAGDSTSEPAPGAEGTGTAAPHAPEANALLTPPAAALGETEDTPEEGTDEGISLLSQPDIAKATEIITNTPCVVSSEELGEVSDFTAGQWVNDVWMKTLAEPLRKQAGVDISDLKFEIKPDGWQKPVDGNNDNPIGESGKLDFTVSGGLVYQELSVPKGAYVTPKPFYQEVTSQRAFTVTGGVEGKDYEYPETVASSEPYRAPRVLTSTPLTISMTAPGTTTNDDGILVPSGVSADITLDGLNIAMYHRIAAPVAIEPGAAATIYFANTNTFLGGYNHAGIEVPTGATATLHMRALEDIETKVEASGGPGAAGVGGPFGDACGTIKLTSWTGGWLVNLKAYGGERNLIFPATATYEIFGGAGIGGGACIAEDGTPLPKSGDEAGYIDINVGTISAYGATRGAGIGGGAYHAPNIRIRGGDFPEVVGGTWGAGIGGGAAASGGVIDISGSAKLKSIKGGSRAAGIGGSTFVRTQSIAGFPDGGEITIGGTASLYAYGGFSGAGIGGGMASTAGVITIKENARIELAQGGGEYKGYGSGASIGSGFDARNLKGRSAIRVLGNAYVNAQGVDFSTAIGAAYGSIIEKIEFHDNCTVIAKGGQRAAGIGSSFFISDGKGSQHFSNVDNITIDGGNFYLQAPSNSAALGSGEGGQVGTISISNANLNLFPGGGWYEGQAIIGTGVAYGDQSGNLANPVPAGQSILVRNSTITMSANPIPIDPLTLLDDSQNIDETLPPLHNIVLTIFGGAGFGGDIMIESGTVEANIPKNKFVFYTQKTDGVIIDGGSFNLEGEGKLANQDPVNSKGQKVYANVLELQDTKEVVEIASGVLEGGAYNFSGIRTDANGITTLFLPATSDGARLRSAEPEAATAGNAGGAGGAAPAYLTGPQLARAKAPNAAISTLASTSGEAIVSMTTTAGIRYQNSFVRPAGQTNQATLYKDGVIVSFDLNGGSGNAPDQTLLPGDTVVSPNVWRSGFRLKEWTLNGQPYDLSHRTTVAEATAGGNFTLVAQWEVRPSTPDPDYAVTVNNGTGDGRYTEGETVTITADAPEEGKRFKEWTVVSGGAVLVDATSASTSFTMPAKAVEVTATYEDETVEPKPDPDPGPSPDPGPGSTPPPGPTDPSTGDGGNGSGMPKPLNPSGNNGAGGAGSGSDAWLVRTGDSPLPLVIAGVGGLALAAVVVAGGILFARRSNALVTRHVIRRH